MKFELLDRYMRRFEFERSYAFPPEMYVVVQLQVFQGERLFEKYKKPYDEELKQHFEEVTRYLMTSPIRLLISYAYLFGEEISLLIPKSVDNLGRLARKVSSLLVGEASGRMSLLEGEVVSFEARLFQLPNEECVIDYFFWRQEAAQREALHRYALHWLVKEGKNKKEASRELAKLDVRGREKILEKAGKPFSSLPPWQTRGFALFWQPKRLKTTHPKTGAEVEYWRKELAKEEELPLDREKYRRFLLSHLNG